MFGKKKIGVALGGGGARGLAHIGVLQVLEDLGVEIDAVSGCSMGAAIGAIYCSGTTLKEIESFINSLDWLSFLLFSDFSLSRSRTGIINGRRVEEVLKKFLGNRTFNDCTRHFCCVAVDIAAGKRILLDSGSLVEAVRASISIPGFFSTVMKDKTILVDGGIIEPLPIEAIKTFNVNFIIASTMLYESEDEIYKKSLHKNIDLKKKISASIVLDRSFNIMESELIRKHLNDVNILIEPKIGNYGFLDFSKGKEIIKCGRIAAERKIPEIKKKLGLK
jgi:NTE family protein